MRKLTQSEFLNKLATNNPNIFTNDMFQNVRRKMQFCCKICGLSWFALAASALKGSGCPKCGQAKAQAVVKHPDAKSKFCLNVALKCPSVTILGEYTDCHSSILVKCNQCSKEWLSKPKNLLKGFACGDCGRERKNTILRLSHDEFEKRVKNSHNGKIKLLETYFNAETKIKASCLCGHVWSPVASKLIGKNKRGCPKCNWSKGELKIEKILQENNISFQPQYVFKDLKSIRNGQLRFDFAVFNKHNELSHLIEFDGHHHFEPLKHRGGNMRFKIQIQNDNIKNEYCQKNEIPLIRIHYREFNKINVQMLTGEQCRI